MRTIAFFDLETKQGSTCILDIGCVRYDNATYHHPSVPPFLDFIKGVDFICGHNIIQHDLTFLQPYTGNDLVLPSPIDTLYLSPLLFPCRPYHRLVKDDQLNSERNNPVSDSEKARDLFYDEIAAFNAVPEPLKKIFYNLLHQRQGFAAFFDYLSYADTMQERELEILIETFFDSKICRNARLSGFIQTAPVSLAYCLSLINSNDRYSITPPWVLKNFSGVEQIMTALRNQPCRQGCPYCNDALDPYHALKRHFGYESFRSYGGEPLQENAVRAAIHNQSLLAIFPTGGGKSITFQLPALMSGENTKGLTVVISPLQSLMKDQVDNLDKAGLTDAVTINGLLDPIERAKAIERVQGIETDTAVASILYISPESLRSVTIGHLLLGRKIARFVIDEAHCFSAWGQDFRVDYLYIGDFIKQLQEKKGLKEKIPVSCFTATAKQKVIEDICTYFKDKLDLDLHVFRSDASRTNLEYRVHDIDEKEKYAEVRRLLSAKDCPAIIYTSRTRTANELAQRLSADGFPALPYHGKMDVQEKTKNQDAFITGQAGIMVATSAFGMGVDKKDVGMVIHYEISDSLENYIQEAGRAGRDEAITAECFVLFNEKDLDKHFSLLNRTKLNIKEIQQVWKAVKELTKTRTRITNSALEIARKAGWDDGIKDIETRVTTAIAALEDAGFIRRGQNMPSVFANSILSKTAQDAIDKINRSERFNEKQKEKAARIIKKLFSVKSKRLSTDEAAECRVDYISDHLGIAREEVIRIINLLRDEKILADHKDLTAFIKKGDNSNRSLAITETYRQLEEAFLSVLSEEGATYNLKDLNVQATAKGCKEVAPNQLKTVINFWAIKNWIKRRNLDPSRNLVHIVACTAKEELKEKMVKRHNLARIIVNYLYCKVQEVDATKMQAGEVLIEFSVQDLKKEVVQASGLFTMNISNEDVEDALFYLSRIEAIKIEGGFLVIYNRLTINRLEKNNRVGYKESDYQKLDRFYRNKAQQIHIVGEYARKMVQNYNDALRFVDDYFQLNYTDFLDKYFPGNRRADINRTLTPATFHKLFVASLSPAQLGIIKDSRNQHIVVAAGPGSGKTKVLAHKLASLLLTEDVRHEQLLMLTFSRAAATEFKKRLLQLVENEAHSVEIKTFHSYCFDLLGKPGTLEQSDTVLEAAVEKIRNGEIEQSRITKTVLVIDEAQDMNTHEYELVKALMKQNEGLRVILVGDDDQNIYGFRGSHSGFMQQLVTEKAAAKYELVENYRSKKNLVTLANQWTRYIPNRLKRLPIMAKQRENGTISIVRHEGKNMMVPLIKDVLQTRLAGSTCVFTKTNEEAVQVAGLLVQNGCTARLIQTNDSFPLIHLKELRYFSHLINNNNATPDIDEETWNEAKNRLKTIFRESSKLDWCTAIIEDFEAVNPGKKYKSDWTTFLAESRFEDFVKIHSGTVYISTIHKGKGKEFDHVFLLLNHFDPYPAENKRLLYVAVTRAKTNLTIHYNGSYLRDLAVENLTFTDDLLPYGPPVQLACLLTHNDVRLSYFEYVQGRMEGLYSGSPLAVKEDGLANSKGLHILKFSKRFLDALKVYKEKGYDISSARVNFMVYWKNPKNGLEVQVVLPEVVLERNDFL